jgi:GNAT superfamily N-acetyltransferase
VIDIRRAQPSDAPAIAALRYAFRTELAAPVESEQQFVKRATAWLEQRLESGVWSGWLAHEAQPIELAQPVGLVLVQLVEKVPNPVVEPESLGYISSFYVRPQWRARGIGDALLRTALDFCRRGGVDTVVLWPSPRSVPLYRRFGFRHRGDVMELRWPADSSPGLRQLAEPASSQATTLDP